MMEDIVFSEDGKTLLHASNSVRHVVIPNNVTKIGKRAFKNCKSLISIEIPDSVTEIGNEAFCECRSLTSIEITNPETRIGKMTFWGCLSVQKDIIVGTHFVLAGKYNLKGNYIIPEGITEIGEMAFGSCKSLASIKIPNSVIKIGEGAFSCCDSLTSIEIPDSITEIGKAAFLHCKSLTSIKVPNSVTKIGELAFYACESLTSIEIPEGITEIGELAFEYCESLTSIIIPNSVTKIGKRAFKNCKSLISIEIPDSVTEIGNEAFCECRSLTTIDIPNSVTKIGTHAFKNCKSLTAIDIASSVLNIGYYPFYHCHSIKKDIIVGTRFLCINHERTGKYSIPQGITEIDAHAFEGCKLESIEIPNSVTKIGYDAFSSCNSLHEVIMHCDNPNLINAQFSYSDVKNIILYVPSRAEYAYSQHPEFRRFKMVTHKLEPHYIMEVGGNSITGTIFLDEKGENHGCCRDMIDEVARKLSWSRPVYSELLTVEWAREFWEKASCYEEFKTTYAPKLLISLERHHNKYYRYGYPDEDPWNSSSDDYKDLAEEGYRGAFEGDSEAQWNCE